jgi:hypothetical protein
MVDFMAHFATTEKQQRVVIKPSQTDNETRDVLNELVSDWD